MCGERPLLFDGPRVSLTLLRRVNHRSEPIRLLLKPLSEPDLGLELTLVDLFLNVPLVTEVSLDLVDHLSINPSIALSDRSQYLSKLLVLSRVPVLALARPVVNRISVPMVCRLNGPT